MASKKKLLQAAAGAAGGAGLDVDEVFSTYLYDGTGSAQTITNNIDLAGEGGLVWTKTRSSNQYGHRLIDEGSNVILSSDVTNGALNGSLSVTQYYLAGQSNGFNLVGSQFNVSGQDYVSWTFRKAPKFFDVVTYTGNFTAGKTVSHNLGSVPGMILIKRTDNTSNWIVYHRSIGEGKFVKLNSTDAEVSNTYNFNNTAPTSTQFTLGESTNTNTNGATYVAYLFAHNNSDGEFGPDSDQDVIKCGSYTGNGSSTGPSVNLGFEPQWIMIKKTNSTQNAHWYVFDAMRGIVTGGDDPYLYANNTNAEVAGNVLEVTPTGFQLNTSANGFNGSSDSYIYMAIRRGPLAEPESATDVFSIDSIGSSAPYFDSNHIVDMGLVKLTTASSSWYVYTRLLGEKALFTDSTAAEVNASEAGFDFMDGHIDALWGDPNAHSWMWKRAPSYFDAVAYKGTGSNRTVSHNLGVAPEMIWVKARDLVEDWNVYHSALGNQAYLKLNTTNQVVTSNTNRWNSTSPTASVFSLGTTDGVNKNSYNYIAYLFATVAGVSKVGSYTGDGNTGKQIDCGFSSGARFVLIKASSGTGSWFVWDSERGIVTGNDPYLQLDNTNAEVTGGDNVDPYSSGFIVNGPGNNASGVTYIFYAIA